MNIDYEIIKFFWIKDRRNISCACVTFYLYSTPPDGYTVWITKGPLLKRIAASVLVWLKLMWLCRALGPKNFFFTLFVLSKYKHEQGAPTKKSAQCVLPHTEKSAWASWRPSGQCLKLSLETLLRNAKDYWWLEGHWWKGTGGMLGGFSR
jgi:hypothetical protein